MEAKLRKYQYILGTAGFGVLLFSAWSLIKAFIFAILQDTGYQAVSEADAEADRVFEEVIKTADFDLSAFLIIVMIGLFSLIIIDIVLRIYIGRTARKVSRGAKKSPAYIVIAVILAAMYTVSMYVSITTNSYLKESYLDTIVTLLIDITSLGTMIAVIISGIQVRRLTRRLNKQNEKEAAVCR